MQTGNLQLMTNREFFFKRFDEVLSQKRRFVVVSHLNPDGDALGSSLAMTRFLQARGHEVTAMVPNDYPHFLAWLPGTDKLLVYSQNISLCKQIIAKAEYILFLDFNHPSRSGLMQPELNASKAPRVLIDHHKDADYSLFQCYLSDTNVSSASELAAEVIAHYTGNVFDKEMSTSLLAGIMTDTGSFSHSVNSPEIFNMCSLLVKYSIPYHQIHQNIYDTFSEGRLRLLGYAINKMRILDEYSTAIITLDKKELESFDYQVGDTEGVVNYPLSIEKIKMSVLLTERGGLIRLSFRSKGLFSVHDLCSAHFSGGGHTNAAGGTFNGGIEDALNKLMAVLPEFKDKLNS